MQQGAAEKINCHRCAHFVITWEPRAPKACKLFTFKSARLPSEVVYHTTGMPCQGFAPKENRQGVDTKHT